MTGPAERLAERSRMEEARRQIQRQLDRINRQITRRMTAFIPQLKLRHSFFRHGKATQPSAFLERYPAQLAALTAERQPEIDALSRKLARQDQAIATLLERLGGAEREPTEARRGSQIPAKGQTP
ncbi:hypothetical protein [Ancylobacter polymorphus]|uniref:Uncharacterized protein n=1 Tax=Ancylobacter polymorphus TaxID=223390 RepID=A0A9E7A0W8_9HYPH|nr:hypothetical protein [Ancylobacter polymorphus]UOK73932.1 hypothetical protein K9D25_24405 [Ancylobacter polymorphus]